MSTAGLTYLATGLYYMAEIQVGQERWQKEILEKWELTKKMPRKKKKRVRKELILEWSIASWDPMEDIKNW